MAAALQLRVTSDEVRDGVVHRIADGLCLAAAPAFAVMALLAKTEAGGVPDGLCGHVASSLGGMAWMYWLMSAVHAAPWLRLIARRGGASGC